MWLDVGTRKVYTLFQYVNKYLTDFPGISRLPLGKKNFVWVIEDLESLTYPDFSFILLRVYLPQL
jgi:hypothetical protein